jgi:hypothetical protein
LFLYAIKARNFFFIFRQLFFFDHCAGSPAR